MKDENQVNLDEFIPEMDTPEKVYQLFNSLGYKVLDTGLKTKPSVYNLPAKDANFVEKIFAVANYGRRFQILLFKLKEDSKEAIRNIPEKILREVDYPFIIFTPDFKTFTFTLVEKVREGPGEFKRKLTKLIVDKDNPYHTDKVILGNLSLPADAKTPTEIYKIFQSAFNVERVTKKFFTEYREVFEKLNKEIVEQNKHLKFNIFSRKGSVENFTKILLGRLMFLYFIQKRGWLNCFDGWGSGDKKFLYNKFQEAKKEKKNYFKDYLEPLFFETLNNPRSDKPDRTSIFGGRIPFLNGGLFEPNYEYKDPSQIILLNNDSFESVFSVFEKYNFTVKEDEPLEKEVAIDPEMLGKVFENLLEENLRKGKGTYYTPREIVHYMCHKSLINYLASEINIDQDVVRNFLDREQSLEKKETLSSAIREKAKEIDEKLANIKVLDPACGSGAFLVDMLREVINARLSLNRVLNRSLSEYELKKATIQNNIYGVDIDPGASEIAKLRLWLTLVVDHNLSEIEPLPNLDYKIMGGNSLIEEVTVNGKSIKLFNYEFFREKQGKKMKNLFEEESQVNLFDNLHWQNIQIEVEQIIKKKKLLFNTFEFEKKQKLRREINDLENELIRKSLRHEAQLLKDRIQYERQKSELKTDKQNKELLDIQFSKSFLDDLINDDEKLNEYKSSNLFLWKLRFIEVFDEKGGFDVVIANPPYVRADSKDPKYQDFRRVLENTGQYITLYEKWDLFIPFIERGLNLLNERGDLNYIVSNAVCTSKYAFKLLDLIQENYYVVSIDYFENMQVFEAGVIPVVLHVSKDPIKQPVKKIIRNEFFKDILSQEEHDSVEFKKLGRLGFKKDYHPINIKIPTINLANICYISKGMVLNSDEKTNKGAFAKDDLISNYKTSINTMPYIEGKYLKKYLIERVKFLEWNTKRVPNLLSRPTFPELYELPKIMRGRVTEGIYDDSGLLCNDSILLFLRFTDLKGTNNLSIKNSIHKFNSLPRNELEKISESFNSKYILSILNSKFAMLYLNNIRRHRLENYFYPNDFRNLPIAKISLSDQKPFAELVDKILALKKSHTDKDKSQAQEYEDQIDQLVYKLYGLTPGEINVVEDQR